MRIARKKLREGDSVIEDIALEMPPKGTVVVANKDLHALAVRMARVRKVVNAGGMRLNTRVGILKEVREVEAVLIGYLQPRIPGIDDDAIKPRVGSDGNEKEGEK